MLTVHDASALRAQVRRWRAAGERVALVPTMGNLHDGHLALVQAAQRAADRVVVSVFVNPLQFGPNEDFDRYPRTLEQDAEKLMEIGTDLLFAPNVSVMYPNGFPPLTQISVGSLGSILEGHYRPGFFTGVATVVNILFNLVQPDLAIFGEKDYQQLQVIRRMVADLGLPIEIHGLATQRQVDGLALSSRNQYLDATQRNLATRLYAELLAVAQALRAGERDFAGIATRAQENLQLCGFVPQYLEIRQMDLSIPDDATRRWVILVAAFMGSTRLIDNLTVDLDAALS